MHDSFADLSIYRIDDRITALHIALNLCSTDLLLSHLL